MDSTGSAVKPDDLPSSSDTTGLLAEQAQPAVASSSKRPPKPSVPLEPMDEILLRRLTTIKEGDNVLLKLPSDTVKAVVASKDGLVQLGKFGAFPASQLLGLHYDITYEILASPVAAASASTSRLGTPADQGDAEAAANQHANFGQSRGKKRKKGKAGDEREGGGSGAGGGGEVRSNPGWRNYLRPLKRQPLVDAVVEDITETNEFIDDIDIPENAILTQTEINELRAQGASAEDLIQRQMERHERFGLKTDFSKEKWRKRKEKKFYQTIHPISPSSHNMVNHYAQRSPLSILQLREDTLSQLLVLANVRPGGRYLVVDDTGGLVTAGILERMGCEGRILLFTESESPPGWGVLNVMNFGERELACAKWLNWMEADEDYQRPPPPEENDLPSISIQKTLNRLRRHHQQVVELNNTRDELHLGNWDGLILATELSPLSILARLTPYLGGSTPIVVYSPYIQILAEVLQYAKRDARFINTTLTESWSRTYQVLPGRTHPTMSTSATGGYLFYCTRVHPSAFQPDAVTRPRRRNKGKKQTQASDQDKGNDEVEPGMAETVERAGTGEEEEEEEELEVVEELEERNGNA